MANSFRKTGQLWHKMVFFENMRISQKLIYFFLGLSLFPVLIVGFTSYISFHEAVRQKVGVYVLDNSNQITANIIAKQKEIQTISDLLFNNKSFLNAVDRLQSASTPDDTIKKDVTSYFGDYMMANRDLFGMMYISNSGKEHSTLMVKDYQDDWLNYIEKFQQTPYYEEVLKSGGSVRWSPAILLQKSHFLMLARSIKNEVSGNPTGVIAILLDEETVDRILNQAIYNQTDITLNNVEHFSVIIDNNGKFLSSPFKDDIGKSIKQIIRNTQPLQETIQGKVSASDFSASENQGSYDSKVKGHTALVTYKTIGLNKNFGGIAGWHLVCFTYHSFLFNEVYAIGLITLLIALIAALIAISISLYVSASISRPLNQVVTAMSRAEEGDLTARVFINSQNELGILGNSYNQMLDKIGGLIINTKQTIDAMLNRSTDLELSSDQSAQTAENVAAAMSEITKGTMDQTHEAEKSVFQMGDLANQIETVVNNAGEVEQITNSTKVLSFKAKEVVGQLIEKTNETDQITGQIVDTMNDLQISTAEIREITDVITNLTEQTNLLGLNASIEAARAGEMGHGFAVVAEEVNKLAAQSREATQTIHSILQTVEQKTTASTQTVNKAHQIVNEQINAVNSAQKSFDEIISAMDNAVAKIINMNDRIKKINDLKDQTVAAISSISAISEQTAASAEEVSASSQEQTAGADQVKLMAQELRRMAEQLVQVTAKFKVDNQ
jgi:methyl-accepting chemotaxis protein